MNKKGIWAVIVIVIIVLVVWGVQGSSQSEVIKIGYVGPFTGPVAGTSGEVVANSWKLAVAEKGTIAGKKIEVIYEDDACDPKKATAAAQKLISIDKVKIVVNGVCSGSNVAMGPIAEQAKVILFTPVSTSPKITTLGDYVFRTSASATHTARAMMEFITRKGYKKVGLMYENQEYTVGVKDALLARGFAPVVSEGFNSTETDMRTHIAKINQAKPDALLVITNSTVTGVAIAKQLKELKVSLPVIANEYFAFTTMVENPDADGIYASQYAYDASAKPFVDFIQKYKDTYKKAPTQDIYAALPYDGFNVLAQALENCKGDDPECVKSELYKIKDFQGISGVITIDQNGDTDRKFVIKQIKNKQLVSTE